MKTALLMFIAFAAANFAVAQTPPENSTSPSSASSPHQRQTTSTPAKETATPGNPEPSAASSPHQKQVTASADKAKAHEKMMKDCMAKQQSMNSSMSQDAAKKACTDQMKAKANNEQTKY